MTNQERAIEVMMDANDGFTEGDVSRMAVALADAGLLMSDLPEPSDWQDDRFTGWLLNENVAVKVNQKGAVIIEHMDVGWFALPPEAASRFADMIKAAANLAEGASDA